MTKIRRAEKRADKKRFIDFIYGVYKGNAYYVDTCLFNCRDLIYRKSTFSKRAMVEPVWVEEDGIRKCQAVLVMPDGSDTLFLSYFDAVAGCSGAADALFDYAKKRAKEIGAVRLLAGINGHLSLGVGILQEGFESKISFDSLYQHEYYKDYFETQGFVSHGLTSYISDKLPCPPVRDAEGAFSVRCFDFERFREEIAVFERLTNDCLSSTDFYMIPQEGFFRELFGAFRLLLKDENIIFVMKDGVEVGYAFWHPDFNEPLETGARNGAVKVWLKNRRQKSAAAKVNAIAVQDKYRGTAAAALLGRELHKRAQGYFSYETTFVWDSNTACINVNLRNGFKPHRRYKVYEYLTERE